MEFLTVSLYSMLYVQVDDNMVNRRVATSMLSRYGATVTSVNGGVEAIESVKNQKEGERFDLVLMDIQMPEV
jgi:histidine kinase 2/3/4 (cytokinin receptor)